MTRDKETECQKCMRFVQKALKGSRCQQLLQSMGMSLQYDYKQSIRECPGDSSNTTDDAGKSISSISLTLPLLPSSSSSSLLGTSALPSSSDTDGLDEDGKEHEKVGRETKHLEVLCTPCGDVGPEAGARAYVKGPEPLSVVLCSNRLCHSEDLESALIHELIHVYDVWERKWDLRNCMTLAHSEVRAAKYAECFSARSVPFFQNYCIQNKASTATNNMFPKRGNSCVQRVFTDAVNDTAPFNNNYTFQTEKTNNNNSSSIHKSNDLKTHYSAKNKFNQTVSNFTEKTTATSSSDAENPNMSFPIYSEK